MIDKWEINSNLVIMSYAWICWIYFKLTPWRRAKFCCKDKVTVKPISTLMKYSVKGRVWLNFLSNVVGQNIAYFKRTSAGHLYYLLMNYCILCFSLAIFLYRHRRHLRLGVKFPQHLPGFSRRVQHAMTLIRQQNILVLEQPLSV